MINAYDSKSKIIFSLRQKLFTPRERKWNIGKTCLNDWVYCLRQDNCFSVMKQTNLGNKINSKQLPSLLPYPWPRLNAAGRWVQKTLLSDQTCSSHPRPRLWCAAFSLSLTQPVRGKSQKHIKTHWRARYEKWKAAIELKKKLNKNKHTTKPDWGTTGKKKKKKKLC